MVRTVEEHRRQEYVGCLGEVAVAMHLDVPWEPRIDVFHDVPDVAHVDVRSVEGCHRRMIVRDDDPDDRPVVFAALLDSDDRVVRAWVRGWLTAREARKVGSLEDPHDKRPAWFVAAHLLRRMDTLPAA